METRNDYCVNRLLVIGPAKERRAFQRDDSWLKAWNATDVSLVDRSGTRQLWQFVTVMPVVQQLRNLSQRWPTLTFLLDYDREDCRQKGRERTDAAPPFQILTKPPKGPASSADSAGLFHSDESPKRNRRED